MRLFGHEVESWLLRESYVNPGFNFTSPPFMIGTESAFQYGVEQQSLELAFHIKPVCVERLL